MKLLIRTTLVVVLINSLLVSTYGMIKSGYPFLYAFVVISANLIIPTFGAAVIFSFLLMFFSRKSRAPFDLMGKLLLNVIASALFLILFLIGEHLIFGFTENTLREYGRWALSFAIITVAIPTVYHKFSYSSV